MDILWAPWRMAYFEDPFPVEGCLFCWAPRQEDSPTNLVVYRGRRAYAMLNRYPYTSAHLMIVPYAHVDTPLHLDEATLLEIMRLTQQAMQVLEELYHPQGFNVGFNIGKAAGAGIREHIHLHVVPRWLGDTNFMTTLAQARVLPEALEVTFEKVRRAWHRRFPPAGPKAGGADMAKQAVVSEQAPRAIGPYSQAVKVGPWVFCSGQLGMDPETGQLVEGGIEAETRQALTNLKHVLAAAGAGLEHVVKVTVYLRDIRDFAAMNTVYAEFFQEPFPARAAVQVAALPKGAAVEIEAVAYVGEGETA